MVKAMVKSGALAGVLVVIALTPPLRILAIFFELPLLAVCQAIEYVEAFGDSCQHILDGTHPTYKP